MKNFVRLLLLLVSIVILFSLNSYSQVSKSEVSNYLINSNILESSQINSNSELIQLDKNVLDEKIVFYDFVYETFPLVRKIRIATIDGGIYSFPEDFNLLTKFFSEKNINIEQRIELLMKILLNDGDKIEAINVTDKQFTNIKFNYDVITWTKINGIKTHWYFSLKKESINIIREEIIDVFSGEYEDLEDVLIPGKGVVNYYKLLSENGSKSPLSETVKIENWEGDIITFNGSDELFTENVIVVNNNNPTPVAERDIEIQISGFGSSKQVRVVIEITGQTPIYNAISSTNFFGNVKIVWTVPSTVHTGKYSITATRVDDNSINDVKSFFIYKAKTGDLPNETDYDYKIYYGDQFANFNSTDIETFASNLVSSIGDVYNEEIGEWGFPSPKTIDNDETLDIYSSLNQNSIYAKSGNNYSTFKYIVFAYNALAHYMSGYNYSSEIDFMNTALCHEFLHSIQYHYPNVFENWGGEWINPNYYLNYGSYIYEGQARFIQTVFMKNHSSGTNNEEFKILNFFYKQSKAYLQNDLSQTVKKNTYDYCLFWRFLYENYNTTLTESERLSILMDVLDEVSGNDPIEDGEKAFDDALSAGGGNYSSFDDAIKDFAKRCYLNDTQYNLWNPCPSDAFYVDPHITATGTLVNDLIEKEDEIPVSFGIDFMEFDIDDAIDHVTFEFFRDPDGNGHGDFYVNLLLMNNGDFVDEIPITITEDNEKRTFVVKDVVDAVIPVIVRLDSDENNVAFKDYKVKIRKDGYFIDIEYPQTGSPVICKMTPHWWGIWHTVEPFDIILSVEDENTDFISGLTKDNFIVKIGGQDIDKINSCVENSEKYTLNIDPKVKNEGLYDLEVYYVSTAKEYLSYQLVEGGVLYTNNPLIEQGLAWLRTQQNTTHGYWTGYSSDKVGATALALQSFLAAGYSPETDENVQKGVDYLLSQTQSNGGIYNWSSQAGYQCAMAITALRSAAKYNPSNVDAINTAITNAQNYYINNQSSYGGWRYYPHSSNDYDLSVSQWAILALEGVENASLWTNVRDKLLHTYCRHSNGGYKYKSSYGSTGTMTCAGIWGEIIADGSQAYVDGGFNWLKNNYGGNTQGIVNAYNNSVWTYYYTYGLSKACALAGKTKLFGENWYEMIYEKLDNLSQTAKYGDNVPEIDNTVSDISPGEMPLQIPGIQITKEAAKDSGKGDDLIYWKNNYSNYETNVLATTWALLSLQAGTVPPNSYLSISLTENGGGKSDCLNFNVYDEFGNFAGKNELGEWITEIPNSMWVSGGNGWELKVQLSAAANLTFEIINNCPDAVNVDLVFEAYQGENMVDEESFNLDVDAGGALGGQCNVNAIGGLSIYISPIGPIATMEINPNVVAFNPFEYDYTYEFEFTISETGGESSLVNIDVFSSNLTDEFGNSIPVDHVSISPSQIPEIVPGGSQLILVSISTPPNFTKDDVGLFEGTITAQSSSSQTKNVNVEIGKPTLSINPQAASVTKGQGQVTFDVEFTGHAGADWQIVEAYDWVEVNPDTGSNEGSITISYQASNQVNDRIAEIPVFSANSLNESVLFTLTQEGTGMSCDHTITIPENWSLISSFVIPNSLQMEEIFSDLDEDIVIIVSSYGIFWPAYNINTIGNWNTQEGYKIKMQNPGILCIYGTPLENKTVELSAGVSYMPMLSETPVDAVDIFGQVSDQLLYAFDIQDQLVYWPEGGIYTLNILEPGRGYVVNLLEEGTVTFPESKNSAGVNQSGEIQNAPWVVNNTGIQHIISIENSALHDFEHGDVIGVFNNDGVCTGMAQYQKADGNLALVVWGDDYTTEETDGMINGEQMNLLAYSPITGEENTLIPVWNTDINPSNLYAENGVSMITSFKSASSLDESKLEMISIYPNPNNGLFMINGINTRVDLQILNSTGQLIKSMGTDQSVEIDLSNYARGIYYLKIVSQGNIKVEKLIVK